MNLVNLTPMEDWVKQVIRVICIVAVVLYVLQALFLVGPSPILSPAIRVR